MIISSELTGKQYKTVQDCLSDEKLYKKRLEEEKRAEEKRKKELEEAYNEAVIACNKYLELCGVKTGNKKNEDKYDLLDKWVEITFGI